MKIPGPLFLDTAVMSNKYLELLTFLFTILSQNGAILLISF